MEPATGKEKLTRETSTSAPRLANLKSNREGGKMLKKTSSMILQHAVLSQ